MVRVGLLVVAVSAMVVLSSVADAKPWIQGVGLPRKVDPENPVEAHATDCKIYYIFNYPMTCGDELVFNPAKLACMAPADVAEDRPECAA